MLLLKSKALNACFMIFGMFVILESPQMDLNFFRIFKLKIDSLAYALPGSQSGSGKIVKLETVII